MEWVNFWWENAPESTAERVLLIGDSITGSYRQLVQDRFNKSGRKVCVDAVYGSRGVEDEALFREIEYMLSPANGYDYKVIHINNGLHGEYITPESYEAGMRRYIAAIALLRPNAKLVLVTSTPHTPVGTEGRIDVKRNDFVLRRNGIVKRLAFEMGLEVDDLFAAVAGKAEYPQVDTVHFGDAGRNKLADTVYEKLSAQLK